MPTAEYIDEDYPAKIAERNRIMAERGHHLCPKFKGDPERAHWCPNKGPAEGCPDCRNCQMT